MGIHSDCFLPKTLIHLWNFPRTSFLVSSSNFAASSFFFHIYHSSAILFMSIIFSFFCFVCFFSFFFFFSSHFLPAFSFAFSSFCFCYPNFLCFLYSFRHLIILTSSVFQLISGLWHTSHGIPKITLHFCSPIISISVLSLYL